MKSCEEYIDSESEYYIYSPSRTALETFLYPIQCGRFLYTPGYTLHREAFDSILILYVEKGSLLLSVQDAEITAGQGSFVLIDCYKPHGYSTATGATCLWCHFDGLTARPYYNAVTSLLGNIFHLTNELPVIHKLNSIIELFRQNRPIREPELSKNLTDILTAFLLYSPADRLTSHLHAAIAEDTLTFINEHFAEDISLDTLALRAGLSRYHFLRIFKEETGYTPHEYLVNIRMTHAKYLLTNTTLSVKDVCFQTGFSCESVFCSAFKKNQGMTPSQYQALTLLKS